MLRLKNCDEFPPSNHLSACSLGMEIQSYDAGV
jgi:hypothetical protein